MIDPPLGCNTCPVINAPSREARKYNDVVIDNVDSNSFGITIESDNPEAFYQSLLDEIERDVFQYRVERDSIPNRTDLSR